MEAAQYRASMVTQTVIYDLDGNGEVTRDEATRAATYQMRMQGYGEDSNQAAQQKRISQQVDRIMALDGNNDGTVTLQEAMQAERRTRPIGATATANTKRCSRSIRTAMAASPWTNWTRSRARRSRKRTTITTAR
jgi:hypothetical protein